MAGEWETVSEPNKWENVSPPTKGFIQKVSDAFTGNDRTEHDLPEFDLPFEFSGRQAKTAVGLMTTFDPKRELSVLKKNYPKLTFSEDKFGNVIVDGTPYGGEPGYLNKPGLSLRDAADIGFQVAAFTPAAKLGEAANLTARALTTGTAAVGTQVAIDETNQSMGEGKASLENVDKSDAAMAGIAGVGGEYLFAGLSKAIPWIKETVRHKGITDEVRGAFKQAAIQAGKSPDDISDDLIRTWLDAANDATDPKQIPAIRDSGEFGIQYSKGQATGDLKQLNIEDSMKGGGLGDKAQKVIQDFAEGPQAASLNQATQKVQSTLGKPIQSVAEMGETVREGIKSKAATLDDAVSEAYSSVGDAKLSTDGLKGLMTRMSRAMKNRDFEQTSDLVPGFASLKTEVDQFNEWVKQAGNTLRPYHIKKIESFRKKIGAKIGAAKNPTDRRQLTIMKRVYDDYLDKAVDRALFQGDDAALDTLKKARSLRAEYARKFQKNNYRTKTGTINDEAGGVIEKMIHSDPTDEQVVNYFFGAQKLGGKSSGAKVAQRVKSTLGADSPEWQSVRQAAFLKLTKLPRNATTISGKQFAGNLEEAIKESPTLMKELFSGEEIALMRRFASAVKRAQPSPVNPPNTANKLAQIVRQSSEKLFQVLGFTQGGIGGAIAAKGAVEGGNVVSMFRGASKARKATRPFAERIPKRGYVAGTIAGTQSQSQ